jgi:hypothetical protein
MADLRLQEDVRAGDRLYRNDSTEEGRTFHEVTAEAGIFRSQIGYGLGVNTSDINGDGWPDIYVSNDFHENDYLYINNGNGTFSERLTEMIGHTSRSSMGNDVSDFNNDALPDIMVLDMLPDDPKIRKQSGGEDERELFKLKLEYGYAPSMCSIPFSSTWVGISSVRSAAWQEYTPPTGAGRPCFAMWIMMAGRTCL